MDYERMYYAARVADRAIRTARQSRSRADAADAAEALYQLSGWLLPPGSEAHAAVNRRRNDLVAALADRLSPLPWPWLPALARAVKDEDLQKLFREAKELVAA